MSSMSPFLSGTCSSTSVAPKSVSFAMRPFLFVSVQSCADFDPVQAPAATMVRSIEPNETGPETVPPPPPLLLSPHATASADVAANATNNLALPILFLLCFQSLASDDAIPPDLLPLRQCPG